MNAINNITDVHVWFLNLINIDIDRAQSLLSPDEKIRQLRFLDPDKSHEFTCTRASLRLAIAHICNLDPNKLEFNSSESGKPYCLSAPHISFNVSHSHMHAIIAVIPTTANLGVDIEYFRNVDVDGLSKRFFSNTEQQLLTARVDYKKIKSFFTIWTRKEACVKAHGKGISLGLQTFSVNYDLPARILESNNEVDPNNNWSLVDITQGDDHAACICCSLPITTTILDESSLWT